MTEAKISQAEMIEMFGEAMPVEAVNLLWDSPDNMTLGQMRAKLRDITSMAKRPSREDSLQAIGDVIEYWIKWVTRQHADAGLAVTPDTHIMLGYEGAPPHWPSVGQLTRWLEVLRDNGRDP